MNDLEKSLCEYSYKNREINKWIGIFKRTKNKRIQNKQFKRILLFAIKEREIIKFSDVVLIDYTVYEKLENQVFELKEQLKYMKNIS